MNPVLVLRYWGFCERAERPLGAKGGTQLRASQETRPQAHGTESLPRKGSSHSLYKNEHTTTNDFQPTETKLGLLQTIKL